MRNHGIMFHHFYDGAKYEKSQGAISAEEFDQMLNLRVEPASIHCVSHPCNSYNSDTLKILNSLGVTLGFRANMETGFSSSLEIPREDHANILREMKECSTVFPGQTKDFFDNSPIMQEYFTYVMRAEENIFGNICFTSENVSSLSLRAGDLY